MRIKKKKIFLNQFRFENKNPEIMRKLRKNFNFYFSQKKNFPIQASNKIGELSNFPRKNVILNLF